MHVMNGDHFKHFKKKRYIILIISTYYKPVSITAKNKMIAARKANLIEMLLSMTLGGILELLGDDNFFFVFNFCTQNFYIIEEYLLN